MAGIGFELKKVLSKGGIARFVTIGLAGTAIVAGPWLLSVVGIFLIQRFSATLLEGAGPLFIAVIVYSNAISLIIASGFHYVFTRWISDLVYVDNDREAGSALALFLILTAAAAELIGLAGVLPLKLSGFVAHPRLFAAGAVLLFVVVNLNWILLSFISLLKEYLAILLVYLGGLLLSLLGVILLGRVLAAGGAMVGYALGQSITALVLYAMTLRRFRPVHLPLRRLGGYIRKLKFLLLAGVLYAWASWADKVVFWLAFGHTVPGGWLRLYDPYDIPVFFATLTLIPSLVFFTIETETSFYPRLRAFLRSLTEETYHKIRERKYAMIRSMGTGLREQALLQAVCTVAFVLLAPAIARHLLPQGVSIAIFRLTLAAVFFHALFLSLMIFLFYFELYPHAFAATGVFFAVNLAASIGIAVNGNAGLSGLSYLAGGAAGCAAAAAMLWRSALRMERILFKRSARGGY